MRIHGVTDESDDGQVMLWARTVHRRIRWRIVPHETAPGVIGDGLGERGHALRTLLRGDQVRLIDFVADRMYSRTVWAQWRSPEFGTECQLAMDGLGQLVWRFHRPEPRPPGEPEWSAWHAEGFNLSVYDWLADAELIEATEDLWADEYL